MTRFLKRSLFVLLAAFFSFHSISATEIPYGDPAEMGFSAEGLAKIQPAMQALVDSGKFAGVLTLIARKGKIVHFETAGLRDRESDKPMTEDTLFRIYSMTKPVTSVAIMMLYEEGKLKLDDPVSKFIPEFAETKVYTGGGTENPILVPLERAITVADLLSHISGLTYGIFGQTSVDTLYRIANLFGAKSNVKYAQKVAQLPLRFQPGTRWLYSVATDILGSVVKVASGMSLGEFFSQRIFVPLEMVDTGFYVPEEKRDRLAKVYGKDEAGNFEARSLRSNTRRDVRESGGGGLVSTLSSIFPDVAQWGRVVRYAYFESRDHPAYDGQSFTRDGTLPTPPAQERWFWVGEYRSGLSSDVAQWGRVVRYAYFESRDHPAYDGQSFTRDGTLPTPPAQERWFWLWFFCDCG